jgi:hypothetical protein
VRDIDGYARTEPPGEIFRFQDQVAHNTITGQGCLRLDIWLKPNEPQRRAHLLVAAQIPNCAGTRADPPRLVFVYIHADIDRVNIAEQDERCLGGRRLVQIHRDARLIAGPDRLRVRAPSVVPGRLMRTPSRPGPERA